MRIVHLTSEIHPFSKTGGLADVSHALPAALAALGHEVTVITPAYPSVARRLATQPSAVIEGDLPYTLWIGDQQQAAAFWIVEQEGVRIVFLRNDAFFARPGYYLDETGRSYADNAARFAFFTRAALEWVQLAEDTPDIVHANDWQSALAPVYLKTLLRYSRLARARSVLTIHNIAYQGLCPAEHIYATGLGWEVFHMEGLEYHGQLNLLKGGIVFADAVTAVSPSYAEEIQTPALGMGLDGVLRKHRDKLRGILNGIDQTSWNPATDPHLPAHFSAEDRRGKAECKRALQRAMGLAESASSFLLASISRFDVQKGIHLIVEAYRSLADIDSQLVVLGSGDRAIEAAVSELAVSHPGRVAVRLGFDEKLAHLIEAGADAFLMPSAYEPCGLNQMYSHRYGTVPIVRETGGLKDTVVDATDPKGRPPSGFTFPDLDAAQLAGACCRAEAMFRNDPPRWQALLDHIMRIDHSWKRSAQAYLQLYHDLTAAP